MGGNQAVVPELGNGGLVFFGQIMANVSHEFNNVITIVGELAGLLHDLSSLAEDGRPIPLEKLKSISGNISKYILRGKEIISHMNKFSHSVDEPYKEFDLQELIENMQALTQRIVERRQMSLSLELPEESISVTGDPFEMRRAFWACLDLFLESSSASVSVSLRRSDNGRELELDMEGDIAEATLEDHAGWIVLKDLVSRLGGRLSRNHVENRTVLHLTIPVKGTRYEER
ncbi:MAG: HAMP domain-containing histidine kinase [Deltaproteobacteria bacterium]|nr:HAMP domain-containing histidine kinase [Deltaproteobacteria bacterium]